jgi:Zn-dependent protease with chaperone function
MNPGSLIYLGLIVSILGGVLVGPIIYWGIARGANPFRAVRVGTYLLGAMILPGVFGIAVLFLSFFGFMWAHILFALLLGLVLQYLLAPYLVLGSAGARDPNQGERWLLSELENLKKSVNYSKKVELKIADVDIPNAFAVGNFFKRAIVVHRGLLNVLNRNEVRAVLAHELGHIVNRDSAYGIATSFIPYTVFMIGVTAMATAQLIASSIGHEEEQNSFDGSSGFVGSFMKGLEMGERAYDDSGSIDGSGLEGMAVILCGCIGALLAGLAGAGIVAALGFSRIREHLADLFSVKATGTTDVLEALRKIEAVIASKKQGSPKSAVPSLRNFFYIVPMVYSEIFGFVRYVKWSKPAFTHPPLEAREFVVNNLFSRNARKV